MIPLRDNIRSQTTPFVNYAMIGACALVFLLQLRESPGSGGGIVESFGMVPHRVLHPDEPVLMPILQRIPFFGVHVVHVPMAAAAVPEWLTLLTCLFLHGGWLHFLGNMLFLYIFGDNVEDRFGHLGYLAFYLLAGVGASLTHLLTNSGSVVPTIGASGAIAGVMGAYLLLFPRARVLTILPIFFFVQVVVLPAPFFLGFWFLLQFFQGTLAVTATQTGGVAWWAHIGGFLFGMAAVWFLRERGIISRHAVEVLPRPSRATHYRVHRGEWPW